MKQRTTSASVGGARKPGPSQRAIAAAGVCAVALIFGPVEVELISNGSGVSRTVARIVLVVSWVALLCGCALWTRRAKPFASGLRGYLMEVAFLAFLALVLAIIMAGALLLTVWVCGLVTR